MANALIEFSNELANSVERGGQSVVAIPEGGRSGVSGTIWRKGIVVAAEHTFRGREEVNVVLPSGQTVSATVAGRDPGTDVAALKIPETVPSVPPEFAEPGRLRPGNVVLALGRHARDGLTASYGVVSAMGGTWRTWHGGKIDQWLRLDLNPYPGFSGGPLVDAAGRVVGINTSGPRRSVVTIPAGTVNRIVDQLLTKGRIARGYVGIGGQAVIVRVGQGGKQNQKDTRGLIAITVAPGGPADRAGVIVGDIILSLDGNSIADPSDLLTFLEPDTVGKTLGLRVLRGGTAVDLKIEIGEREED